MKIYYNIFMNLNDMIIKEIIIKMIDKDLI